MIFDLLGLIPGFGVPFNIANTITYALEEKWLDATLSFIGSIPTIGEAIRDGGWISKNLLKLAKNSAIATKHIKTILKHSSTVVKMIEDGLKFYFDHKKEIKIAIKALRNSKSEPIQKNIVPHLDKMEESMDVLDKNFKDVEKLVKSSEKDTSDEDNSQASLAESIAYVKRAQKRILAEENEVKKITIKQLKQLIKEEVEASLQNNEVQEKKKNGIDIPDSVKKIT